MKQILAIKGHPTRFEEVLEILEMLGGKNDLFGGGNKDFIYYIRPSYDYIVVEDINNCNLNEFTIFTIEEFLAKYPYKVGDKVKYKDPTMPKPIYVIEKMKWEDNQIKYIIRNTWVNARKRTVTAEELQLYKEESMEEKDEKSVNHVFNTEVISFDIAQNDKYELDLQGKFNVVLREGKYYVERIKPKYPKTYEECCKVLDCKSDYFYTSFSYKNLDVEISDYEDKIDDLLQNFRKLIYCRDAYWKIAGKEMGLSEAWKPDWNNDCQFKYIITGRRNNIIKDTYTAKNCTLAFPTKEMRDEFYENFKDIIEKCKDYL